MITDDLLFRYLNRETNRKENRTVDDWLSGNPDHSDRLNHLKEIFEPANPETISQDLLNSWISLDNKLFDHKPKTRIHPVMAIRLARVAAVLLILVSSGLFWYFQSDTNIVRNKNLYTRSVLLPDGTRVDLGPGSKLVYGREFMEGIRVIRLTGEACFDVTSDPEHPFTVMAGEARIKVTGTRFIVNALPRGEEVEVSVKSGKVLFYNSETMNKNSFRMGLVAGEKGIFYPALNRMDKTSNSQFHNAT
jgi:transmembrane sensor